MKTNSLFISKSTYCPSYTEANLGNGLMKIAFTESSALLQEYCLLKSDHSSCHLASCVYICRTSACPTCMHICLLKTDCLTQAVSCCLPSSTILKTSSTKQVRHACVTPGHVRVHSKACMSRASAEEWGLHMLHCVTSLRC